MELTPQPAADFSPVRPAPARTDHRLLALGMAIAAFMGVAGGALGNWTLARLVRTATVAQPAAPTVTAGSAAVNPAAAQPATGTIDGQAIAAKVDPAIVDINTVILSAGGSGQASATGLILTSGGEILTNNHVVSGSTSIAVTISGRSGTYPATVVGVDPAADVALIQLKGVAGLPTVKLSTATQVGQAVVALGNALGKGGVPALTQGFITGVDQSVSATDDTGNVEQLTGMLQTDATIVPGDSGGALVDASGTVVGMLTAGDAQSYRFQGGSTGFAVPAGTALSIVNRMLAGQAGTDIVLGQPGYIGVSVANLDQATADQLGVAGGVLVSGVQSTSPAARAGMTAGAVITAVGSTPVTSFTDLGAAIHSHHPGQRLAVTWVDAGGTHSATLTLVGGPAV